MAYKGSKKALSQIARELGVDAVVEGAVVLENGRARTTVQVFGTQPERQLWSEHYERDVSSILALQQDVAQAVAVEIHAKLTPKERSLLSKPRPIDPQAYEAYLTGRYFWHKHASENLLKARACFEAAIGRDQQFAPAFAGVARAHAWAYRLLCRSLRPPREVFPQAKAAALKALELDETLPEAHLALAFIKQAYDWDWQGAERSYLRAIELNPNSVDARFEYALYLTIPRRFDEAFAQMKRTEELEPVARSERVRCGKAWLYYWAQKFDDALREAHSLLELDPTFGRAHYLCGLNYTAKGLYDEAIASYHKAMELWGDDLRLLAFLGRACGKAGQRSEALAILAHLNERAQHEYVPGIWIAHPHMGLGNHEEAVQCLVRSFEQRDELDGLARAPLWFAVPLRADPRVQDLLRRLQFPSARPGREGNLGRNQLEAH